MCESSVLIERGSGRELLMEDVVLIAVDGEDIKHKRTDKGNQSDVAYRCDRRCLEFIPQNIEQLERSRYTPGTDQMPSSTYFHPDSD
jgi:hypothetical protein